MTAISLTLWSLQMWTMMGAVRRETLQADTVTQVTWSLVTPGNMVSISTLSIPPGAWPRDNIQP